MTKSVIHFSLLFLYITSVRGRVQFKDAPILDLLNNSITEIVKERNITEYKEIRIELPTTSPNDSVQTTTTEQSTPQTVTARHENVTNITVEDKIANTTCEDIADNTIEGEESATCPPAEEDVGVALKLTPYITESRLEEARNASRVDPELFLGFESYSGFLTVNETYDSNIFFWYFPVASKPVNETPWVVWLQGGPGASSMTGLFDEIGPFRVRNNTLVKNPYTWLQDHSLLFIENPVGTGFSYTNSEDGYAVDMDTYGDHLYAALQQFLRVFPELAPAPLFVAGESYAGKYVPALALRIHRRREQQQPRINLQGLMAGNAYIDPPMIAQLERPFYRFGLLDAEQEALLQPLIRSFRHDVAANNSVAAKAKWNRLVTGLLLVSQMKHAYNFLRDELGVGAYTTFLATPQVRRALHVGGVRFSYVNMTVNARLDADFLSSAKWMYEELLQHYRVLAYCGQLDLMLSCAVTSENYRTWRWNGTEDFLGATRLPIYFNGRLSGYCKSGGRLSAALVRGAGHMAPLDAPAPLQQLAARFTRGLPLAAAAPRYLAYLHYLASVNDTALHDDAVVNYF